MIAPHVSTLPGDEAVRLHGGAAGVLLFHRLAHEAKPVDTIFQVTRSVTPEWLVEIEVDAKISGWRRSWLNTGGHRSAPDARPR